MAEVRKFLTCAAHHLPLEFAKHLAEAPLEEWRVAGLRGPFGFFVYCHEDPDPEIPDKVLAIMRYARFELGCEYIYFDQDGEDLDGFAIFEPDDCKEAHELYEQTGDDRLRTVM